jgi:hypothetical protein
MPDEAKKWKVIGLRRTLSTGRYEYELLLHDPDETTKGYTMTNRYGTETEVRAMLQAGGMSEEEIDVLFEQAS